MLCEDMYLIQADHVAETSVLSGDQLLREKAFLRGGSLDPDLLLGLREVSHEPQDDPPHCQRSLVITETTKLMKQHIHSSHEN